MKRIGGLVVTAVVLVVAGVVCLLMGRSEQQLAEGREQLATLRYAQAADQGEPDPAMQYAARVPEVGSSLLREAQESQVAASYWLTRYGALPLQRDASGALVEKDPQITFLGANAAYRAARLSTDRAQAARQLEALAKNYGDVLRNSPGHEGAAYNYELVIRMRDVVAKGRAGAPGTAPPDTAASSGSTIHGQPGGPPKGTDTGQFMILVPKRSDERIESQEPGKTQEIKRKG